MDIMQIIDMMEEIIEKAPPIPFTGKVLVDKEDILDYIQNMRLEYPDALKEASWIKEERQHILSDAEKQAETMQKNAENKLIQLVDEHEITRQAVEQANEMMAEAVRAKDEMTAACDKYAFDVLGDIEHRLELLLQKVKEDKSNYGQ